MYQELNTIILSLRDAIGELDEYSVYHDDVYNDEVGELLQIVYDLEKEAK